MNSISFFCHWTMRFLLKLSDRATFILEKGYYEIACSQEAHMYYGEEYTLHHAFLNFFHGALSAFFNKH